MAKSRIADYSRSIRAAVRGLWSGDLSYNDFLDAIDLAVRTGLTRAWYEGAAECGIIAPQELTIGEIGDLNRYINIQMGFVFAFANDINASSKANKGKLTPLMERAKMWTNRYNEARNYAKQLACADQKLEWIFGDTKHCSSCLKLNGRVYRASIWAKYDVRPQHPSLECRGFHCACIFQKTNKPATRGRPPSLP